MTNVVGGTINYRYGDDYGDGNKRKFLHYDDMLEDQQAKVEDKDNRQKQDELRSVGPRMVKLLSHLRSRMRWVRAARAAEYEAAKELWEAILKTFGGNEATKKTKKNQLKQQYGNFKAEGLETLEQTFNRLQAIVSHLEFMDVEIEQNDLNQKFLTSLALEWLMYTIVWRNIDDLDTMSLDDMCNHLKVYEPEVQKKSESKSQNMAFISSSNTSSGKGEVHTASVPTASIQVSTASTNVAAASLNHDTTGKKITIQGSDVAGFDKSKVECFNCHNMGHFSRECRAPRSQDRGKRESYKQRPKEEEPAPKALMAIDGIGWDWSYMANEEDNHALVADDEVEARLVEFKEQEIKFCEKIRGLERDVEIRDNKIEYLINELEKVKKEKEGLDNKLTGFESASKDLDNLLGSQRLDKNKKGLGYNAVPPSPAQVYSPPKKDLSWIGSIMSQPMIKFVKAADCPRVTKTNNTKNSRKSTVKYAEMYRNTTKNPKVRGNQRNWNNLKSQQLGKDFLMQNKACFKCGHFDHLAYDCGVWVEKGKIWPKNNYSH
nr:hypothetical protein [Tanacetum cinerariifolium]